jgi:hypothetical protein
MNTSSIPVWQSEMAPPKIRGFLVLFEGALITAGPYDSRIFSDTLSDHLHRSNDFVLD